MYIFTSASFECAVISVPLAAVISCGALNTKIKYDLAVFVAAGAQQHERVNYGAYQHRWQQQDVKQQKGDKKSERCLTASDADPE